MARVIAIASNGGHLVQLNRLSPAFDEYTVTWVTTSSSKDTPSKYSYVVTDCNFNEKVKFMRCVVQAWRILKTERPAAVVTTGAAPGLAFLLCAKVLRCNGIWLDSIANVDQLSTAGKIASRITVNCYTQWPHLANGNNVKYIGAVL